MAAKVAFESHIDAVPNGCWEWRGIRTADGYGVYWSGGVRRPAHRVAYERANGAIPEGLQIDHLCRNRACVNAAHLEAVTLAENLRRGADAVTHCPHGHEYTPENTRQSRKDRSSRSCRTCHREKQRAYVARRRAL